MNERPWMHIDPAQLPTDLKEPATDAGQPPGRCDVSGAAAAERERIKAAGAVSACCGTTYTRPTGAYSRWTCDECGRECDLIGVIALTLSGTLAQGRKERWTWRSADPARARKATP